MIVTIKFKSINFASMSTIFEPIITANDDNLIIPEVGQWSIQKYKLLGKYSEVFTNSMKKKWSHLVYLDLFSGSGYSKIKKTNQILFGSPLIAMSLPFTDYIFCEKDKELIDALRLRVERHFPEKISKVKFFNHDSNNIYSLIKNALPRYSKSNLVLSFCFVDPFSLELNFNTIKELGQLKMDFLVLLALHMDANRNYHTYADKENNTIDLFLSNTEWRALFQKKKIDNNEKFVKFLADEYKTNMENLGYKIEDTFHQIRSDDKNLPLYYLAFFSKHNLGNKFWSEIQKYSKGQTKFEF